MTRLEPVGEAALERVAAASLCAVVVVVEHVLLADDQRHRASLRSKQLLHIVSTGRTD